MAIRKKSLLTRAFKSGAERIAGETRKAMGLAKHDPLCAFKLADHLGIPVRSIYDFGIQDDEEKYDDWSAVLIYNKYNKPIIVHNKAHSLPRQQSDLMHEISHYQCGHSLGQQPVDFLVPTTMLTVNSLHEEEASWLGATLQLPREALSWAIYRHRMTMEQIAELFVASKEMVRYRINMTGLSKEFQRLQLI